MSSKMWPNRIDNDSNPLKTKYLFTFSLNRSTCSLMMFDVYFCWNYSKIDPRCSQIGPTWAQDGPRIGLRSARLEQYGATFCYLWPFCDELRASRVALMASAPSPGRDSDVGAPDRKRREVCRMGVRVGWGTVGGGWRD